MRFERGKAQPGPIQENFIMYQPSGGHIPPDGFRKSMRYRLCILKQQYRYYYYALSYQVTAKYMNYKL